MVEIRSFPDGLGGWVARARLRGPDPDPGPALTRSFRSADRAVALGKMTRWVRGRFPEARPLRGLPARELPLTIRG